jgi:hypothetical protein
MSHELYSKGKGMNLGVMQLRNNAPFMLKAKQRQQQLSRHFQVKLPASATGVM